MLFHQGFFSTERVADPRARAALAEAAAVGAVLGCGDLLAGAVRAGDPRALSALTAALGPGASAADLLALAGPLAPAGGPAPRRTRQSFRAAALRALDEFDALLACAGGLVGPAALELLLLCVLGHFEEHDRRAWAPLDAAGTAELFRGEVEEAVGRACVGPAPPGGPDAQAGPEDTYPLPPEVAPSEDLTALALSAGGAGEFPFDGEPAYERLFTAAARVLHRRQGHHVLLTGEPGVGTATVAAQLARRAASGAAPSLAGARFLRVDCRHVPPDESRHRLAAVLAHTADDPGLVVCLDGLGPLLGGDCPAASRAALLAGLARARCRLIGLLTPGEYEEHFAGDRDLAEHFERVDVPEPDPALALKLLRHYAAGLEGRYGVAIDPEAVRQAVTLSADYVLGDRLPAKALKVLRRVCEDVDFERGQAGGAGRVTAERVVGAVAEVTGVPEETLRGVAGRCDYEGGLRAAVFGQDRAIAEVAAELGLIKAGMTDPGKPASVMLFLGQTGTGKTETAKALARFYSAGGRLRTYALGNCVEPHSVSTLIGVPPGYVGHDRGSRLVNDLNADPHCVFLLDEADKAHPDALQPLLNLFDEGWVCDQRGARGYAGRSIFILTSNVGQRMIAEMAREGKPREEIAARMKEALSQIRHSKSDRPVFAPEFLARVKRVIVFEPLGAQAMAGIAGKLSGELRAAWAGRRGKQLEIPESLLRHVAEQAHLANERSQGKEGGRVVRKLMADWVESPLQRAVSERPGAYRAAAAVVLDFAPPAGPAGDWGLSAPGVSVRFESGEGPAAA